MEVEQAQQAQQQQDGQQQQPQEQQQQQDGGTFDMWAPQVRPGAACGWLMPPPDSQRQCQIVRQPGCGPVHDAWVGRLASCSHPR